MEEPSYKEDATTEVTNNSTPSSEEYTNDAHQSYDKHHNATSNDQVDAYTQAQRDILSGLDAQYDTSDSQPSMSVDNAKQFTPRIPYMEVVGQVHGTYIVAQNDEGMYLIDQHAAQERIKYEYFRDKIGEVSNENQNLLIPLTFTFTKDEQLFIEENIEALQRAGIFLEPFGGHDYIVNSYPVWFPQEAVEETIKDIIHYALEHKTVNIAKFREELAIMMSCKKSIKANHYLKNNEMADLINQLRQMEDPFTCPHGRPIIINFTNYELERLFKRIQ